MKHGYSHVFSMAVGTIGEWLKLVPFFVRGSTVDWGGGQFLKNKYPGRQTSENKYPGLGP